MFKRIRQGDEKAFEILFYRYYQRLFAFAVEFVQYDDTAKDIVQDVYIKLWEKRRNLEEISLKGLLYTMVRNQCLNHLRNKKVFENKNINLNDTGSLERLYQLDFIRNEPEPLILEQLEQEIHQVMESLPEKSRQVFELSRMEGLKNKEIAKELECSLKNVEKHMSKALEYFRKHFNYGLSVGFVLLTITDSLCNLIKSLYFLL
jgi:RNA polymerase sigma-70 factor (ECF subfamily)